MGIFNQQEVSHERKKQYSRIAQSVGEQRTLGQAHCLRLFGREAGLSGYHGEGGQRRLREEIISLRNSVVDD